MVPSSKCHKTFVTSIAVSLNPYKSKVGLFQTLHEFSLHCLKHWSSSMEKFLSIHKTLEQILTISNNNSLGNNISQMRPMVMESCYLQKLKKFNVAAHVVHLLFKVLPQLKGKTPVSQIYETPLF